MVLRNAVFSCAPAWRYETPIRRQQGFAERSHHQAHAHGRFAEWRRVDLAQIRRSRLRREKLPAPTQSDRWPPADRTRSLTPYGNVLQRRRMGSLSGSRLSK